MLAQNYSRTSWRPVYLESDFLVYHRDHMGILVTCTFFFIYWSSVCSKSCQHLSSLPNGLWPRCFPKINCVSLLHLFLDKSSLLFLPVGQSMFCWCCIYIFFELMIPLSFSSITWLFHNDILTCCLCMCHKHASFLLLSMSIIFYCCMIIPN